MVQAGDVVVKQGVFVYAGTVECDLRIVRSEIVHGSGDHEDPPEVRDDQPGPGFYVWYGSTSKRGEYRAGSGGFSSLEEAMAEAASHVPGLRWL